MLNDNEILEILAELKAIRKILEKKICLLQKKNLEHEKAFNRIFEIKETLENSYNPEAAEKYFKTCDQIQ